MTERQGIDPNQYKYEYRSYSQSGISAYIFKSDFSYDGSETCKDHGKDCKNLI